MTTLSTIRAVLATLANTLISRCLGLSCKTPRQPSDLRKRSAHHHCLGQKPKTPPSQTTKPQVSAVSRVLPLTGGVCFQDTPTTGHPPTPLTGTLHRAQERRPQPHDLTHHCPLPGEAITGCCGRTPFELPTHHRLTIAGELVTCRGAR